MTKLDHYFWNSVDQKKLVANESTLGIFLDLSKAFDTINHKILCHKRQHYGIQDTALPWIKDSICPVWVPSILL